MNYGLAKKLRDAGFPQDGKNYTVTGGRRYAEGINSDEFAYVPTLSELIEACGDILLYKLPKNNKWSGEKGVWVASDVKEYLCADTYFIDTSFDGHIGLTPEEAVARLWLALNKKT